MEEGTGSVFPGNLTLFLLDCNAGKCREGGVAFSWSVFLLPGDFRGELPTLTLFPASPSHSWHGVGVGMNSLTEICCLTPSHLHRVDSLGGTGLILQGACRQPAEPDRLWVTLGKCL